MKFKSMLLVALVFFAGCEQKVWTKNASGATVLTSYGHKQKAKYAERTCSQKSMVGQVDTFSAVLEAKREELDSLDGSITLTRKNELSQELSGYDVRWQTYQNDRDVSCRIYAACLFDSGESAGYCSRQREDFNASRTSMNKLLLALQGVEITSG